MTPDKYLELVLREQTFAPGSDELEALRSRRKEVEEVLKTGLPGSSPTIKYGGSKAKGTMIKDSYDLDILCYFPHDEEAAGTTLRAIYDSVHDVLAGTYMTERKASAIRLWGPGGADFHIDVVPGRFIDDSKNDVFLFQSSGEKERLKTNPSVHIEHVQRSGVREAIRLLKLWNVRCYSPVKTFVLELLVIDVLRSHAGDKLSSQVTRVWEHFRDNADDLTVEDPANPSGNDLSSLLDAGVRISLSTNAANTLRAIDDHGWEQVFGEVEMNGKDAGIESLERAAATVITPSKPWSNGGSLA